MNLLNTRKRPAGATEADPRPRFAIGHVFLPAADIDAVADFYEGIGMRGVARMPRAAIIELRGGTHIAITEGEPGATTLDLMVDDLDETRAVIAAAGGEPTEITSGFPHHSFTATDPEGNVLVVNSSHVAGPV